LNGKEKSGMKKGAIFDMDGTLLDTEKFYAQGWIEIAKKLGLPPEPKLPRAMSGASVVEMPEIASRYYPGVDAKAYIDEVFAFVRRKKEEDISLMAGVREILDFFRQRGIPMAVASSSFREVVEANLKTAGIREYFDAVVGGDQVRLGKPDPEIFVKAAGDIGVPPEECYIFEDSFNGIRAAHAAGGMAIMIPDQTEPNEEIRGLCTVYRGLQEALQAIRAEEK